MAYIEMMNFQQTREPTFVRRAKLPREWAEKAVVPMSEAFWIAPSFNGHGSLNPPTIPISRTSLLHLIADNGLCPVVCCTPPRYCTPLRPGDIQGDATEVSGDFYSLTRSVQDGQRTSGAVVCGRVDRKPRAAWRVRI